MPEKVSKMSHAVNWQDEIGAIAGSFDGNRKGWLDRAARTAQVSFRQVKALYYGEIKNPRLDTASAIINAATQARLNEARRNAHQVAEIYRRHAEALAAADQDFHRNEIDALLTAARILGSRDSA